MAKKKKDYTKAFFIEMNMQNPPKPVSMNWYVRYADSQSIPENTVEGYEFTVDKREDSFGVSEGFSPDKNFRCAFLPEVGHYWLSRDFAGQELRILANLADEDVWIKTFLEDGDPHEATAKAIWGIENYSKEKRKAAKAINFGLVYGTGPESLAESLGITKKEAESHIEQFFKSLPNIKLYLDRCAREAVQNREIKNLYGRKRRMLSYIDANGNLMGLGRRKSYNFPVQSLGAEIQKLAIIKLYHGLIKNPKYEGKVFFMSAIHDEINTSVQFDLIKEVTKLQGDLMLHKIPGKPVPITTGIEIGHSMGLTWKFKQDIDTLELTPVLTIDWRK